MKVAVLTTSYPRYEGDPAGTFVADGVEQLRAAGVEVEVVSPASFDHHGIAYGAGIVGNMHQRDDGFRARPGFPSPGHSAGRGAGRG